MATIVEDISDSEGFQASTSGLQSVINTAMLQASALKAAGGTNTTQYVIEMDRSDDEESDHTSDLYATQPRGRVSPSPYTANTDRARQFNTYVRGMIEQKLDILIPISHQPRELITEIISDASSKFPEFSSCVRKRIRTFLKSYRRSKKIREGPLPNSNGYNKLDDSNYSASPEDTIQTAESVPVSLNSSSDNHANTTIVTIDADTPTSNEDHTLSLPSPKRARLSNPIQNLHSHVKNNNHTTPPLAAGLVSAATAAAAAAASGTVNSSQSLNNHEVLAVRQLITGYRESAAFLQRAADQLEDMLHKNTAS